MADEFGGDAGVIGKPVRLDSESYTIIGVMPQAFRFPTADALYWTATRFPEQEYSDRNNNWHYPVGRLRAGASSRSAPRSAPGARG
ncbi:MAG: hypothetical protein LAO77_21140 [Acidobacteriia bacterium]|nr:hypothetical protein [Terriglobia bacterium]